MEAAHFSFNKNRMMIENACTMKIHEVTIIPNRPMKPKTVSAKLSSRLMILINRKITERIKLLVKTFNNNCGAFVIKLDCYLNLAN